MSPSTPACPSCGEPVTAGERFCEACGAGLPGHELPTTASPDAEAPATSPVTLPVTSPTDLSIPTLPTGPPAGEVPPCTGCGATDGTDADGFCLQCGVRAVRPGDRREATFPGLAAVTDRGPRKLRNEDAFAVAPLPGARGWALAVCDGVSNIPGSGEAAQAACDVAVEVLASPVPADPVQALNAAAARASAAVSALATAGGAEPPSCTFLAARWHPDEGLAVGWIGDCRAYLVETGAGTGGADGDGGRVRLLTVDHSWGTEAVREGLLTQAQADADDRSHAITRWLGADAPGPPEPEIVHRRDIPKGTVLVAVSDGAWNYLDRPGRLAGFFADGDLLAGARGVTGHAVDGGGHDNITVVAVALDPDPDPDPVPPEGT